MKEIIDDGSGALRVGQLDAKYNALKNKITASVEASASSSSYTKVLESEHGKPVQATADPEEVDDDDDAKSHASVEHEEDDDDVLASILGGPSAAKKPKAATPASKGGRQSRPTPAAPQPQRQSQPSPAPPTTPRKKAEKSPGPKSVTPRDISNATSVC